MNLRLTTLGFCIGVLSMTAYGEVYREGFSPTQWGQPLSGGPVRTVVLAPYGSHQDTHELMSRFELDATVIGVTAVTLQFRVGEDLGMLNQFYYLDLLPGKAKIVEQVRSAVKGDWQVMVMCATPAWDRYPSDIRQTILDQVIAGKTLFVTGLTKSLEDEITSRGLTPEAAPLPKRFGWAQPVKGKTELYRLGKGHLVVFSVPNDLRFGYLLSSEALQSDFELSAARAGWFLTRSINGFAENTIKHTAFDKDKVIVEINPSQAASVSITVRSVQTYRPMVSSVCEVKKSEQVVAKVPVLAAGDYQAEVIVKDTDGKVCDWDVIRFAIKRPVAIKSIAPDNKVCKAGDTINIKVETDGAPENVKTTLIRWYDNWSRLLTETSAPTFNGKMKITVPQGSLSVINRLEVELVGADGPLSIESAEMLMPDNATKRDFYMLYWNNVNAADSWRRRLFFESLRRVGSADGWVNTGVTESVARQAALENLRVIPYTTAFHGATLDGHLFNEEWLNQTEQKARACATDQKAYSPLAFTLGDENYVSAFKPNGRFLDKPEVWKAFADYLKSIYSDVNQLNAQWGTAFKTFDAVRFNSDPEMFNVNNPSAWTDYRMFTARQFSRILQRMRKAIVEVIPDATVGMDGSEQFSSYDGYDWWELTREMDMTQIYQFSFMPQSFLYKLFNGQAASSFSPTAKLSGVWMNDCDPGAGQYIPWYLALNGWNSVWWWHAMYPHPANGALQWDLKLHPIMHDTAMAVEEIKAGPATLLKHATRKISPIAIHYSANNFHASNIESGVGNHVNNLGFVDGFWMSASLNGRKVKADDDMKAMFSNITPAGHYAAASANFYVLLHDLGYQPRTMARQEIEADALIRDGIRVLILPFVVSLSEEEIQKIRSFVEAGGTLIADYRPGLRDLHGKLRTAGPLDDVFGIKRNSFKVTRNRQACVMEYDDRFNARLETIFHDDIHAVGARAYGMHDDGTSAFLVHTFGKGNAIYFNSDLYAYYRMRKDVQTRDFRDLIGKMLNREADVFPAFTVRDELGSTMVDNVELTSFVDGPTSYYGVIPDFSTIDKSSMKAKFTFPSEGHMYDVREKKYLGFGTAFVGLHAAAIPKLLAILPYSVSGLDVGAPDKIKRGSPVNLTFKVNTSNSRPGPHVLVIRVKYPDGTDVEYLTETVYLPKGSGMWQFTPALNVPLGNWTIEVTEAVSGIKKQVVLKVE